MIYYIGVEFQRQNNKELYTYIHKQNRQQMTEQNSKIELLTA